MQTPHNLDDGWTATQRLVVALCVVVNMLDGMDVLALSYVAPALQGEWHLGSDRMGLVFSAGIVGMAMGSLLIAPLADLFGRRPLVLATLALSSCAMLLSGFANDVPQLLALRVLVGIGIGSVLPTMAALIAEYAPDRDRNFAVGLLYAGYPLGAILAGVFSAWVIPLHGWRAVLIGVGVLSLATCPLLWTLLPESLEFLRQRRPAHALAGINGGIRGLLADGRTTSTLLLWAATISGFMSLWFVISWIPRLAQISGLGTRESILAGTLFNAGALAGTILLGSIARRFTLQRVIPVFLVAAAVAMMCLGGFRMPAAVVMGTAFLIGVLLQGGFNGIYPLAARLYPAAARSTGIGWATGIGRIGAVAGPALGGILLERNAPLWLLCAIFAAPAAFSGLCAARVVTNRTGAR